MLGPYYVTNDERRRTAWGPPCTAEATAAAVVIDGRTFRCHTEAAEPFQAWERIRAHHGYRLTGDDTGIYNCRHMQHNPALPYSYHSWGMALDVNWLENPAGNKLTTDIPQPMIDDLLALRTVSGARVFRWGGDWDWDGQSSDHSYVDAMHWEVVAHPLDLATGIDEGEEMKIPQPDWLPDDVIDRLIKHKYLTYRPESEPETVWRMFTFMDRMDRSLRKAIAAAAATAGTTAAAVIAEIVNRLS